MPECKHKQTNMADAIRTARRIIGCVLFSNIPYLSDEVTRITRSIQSGAKKRADISNNNNHHHHHTQRKDGLLHGLVPPSLKASQSLDWTTVRL